MNFLRTLFLTRIPVFFLVLVGFLAIESFSNPVLEGLFSLASAYSLFLVALAAMLVGLGATSSINLIRQHGRERMQPDGGIGTGYPPRRPHVWIYVLCMISPSLFIA